MSDRFGQMTPEGVDAYFLPLTEYMHHVTRLRKEKQDTARTFYEEQRDGLIPRVTELLSEELKYFTVRSGIYTPISLQIARPQLSAVRINKDDPLDYQKFIYPAEKDVNEIRTELTKDGYDIMIGSTAGVAKNDITLSNRVCDAYEMFSTLGHEALHRYHIENGAYILARASFSTRCIAETSADLGGDAFVDHMIASLPKTTLRKWLINDKSDSRESLQIIRAITYDLDRLIEEGDTQGIKDRLEHARKNFDIGYSVPEIMNRWTYSGDLWLRSDLDALYRESASLRVFADLTSIIEDKEEAREALEKVKDLKRLRAPTLLKLIHRRQKRVIEGAEPISDTLPYDAVVARRRMLGLIPAYNALIRRRADLSENQVEEVRNMVAEFAFAVQSKGSFEGQPFSLAKTARMAATTVSRLIPSRKPQIEITDDDIDNLFAD